MDSNHCLALLGARIIRYAKSHPSISFGHNHELISLVDLPFANSATMVELESTRNSLKDYLLDRFVFIVI